MAVRQPNMIRWQAIDAVAEGESRAAVARRLGVSSSAVTQWVREREHRELMRVLAWRYGDRPR